MASPSKGLLVVVSAPSGCGKDTVLGELCHREDVLISRSVSMTTRAMRSGEVDGVDYYFTTVDDFKNKITENYFIEYVNFGANFYGTPKAPVDKMLEEGKCVVLKIEVEGAGNIRKLYPDCVSVFIAPPSFDELKARLKNRGTETEEEYNKRVEIAKEELKRAKEYDYIVINDEISRCADDISDILNAESLRCSKMNCFVEKLIN